MSIQAFDRLREIELLAESFSNIKGRLIRANDLTLTLSVIFNDVEAFGSIRLNGDPILSPEHSQAFTAYLNFIRTAQIALVHAAEAIGLQPEAAMIAGPSTSDKIDPVTTD